METGNNQANFSGVEPQQPNPRAFDADVFTRALRVAGAALVVASASTFMLQKWISGNDLVRYGMLVGQALLLSTVAYFVGLIVREGRSARTLLALMLATMPACFAVLGGLVYSRFHFESMAPLPLYASWVAPSKLAVVIAVGATLLVLGPLALVAFVSLARKEAKWLTFAFLLANGVLLVPVRAPGLQVLLAGLSSIALLLLETRRFALSGLSTLEGKLARTVLFIAPWVIVGRAFHFYHSSQEAIGFLLLVLASAAWLLLPRIENPRLRELSVWCTAALAVYGWGRCWDVAWSGESALLCFGLPSALLIGMASLRANTTRRALGVVATLLALGSVVLDNVFSFSAHSAFVSIAVGVALAVWGAAVRSWVRGLAGGLVALCGLVLEVWLASNGGGWLRWLSLSVTGVALIVASAYVERHRGKLQRWFAPQARTPV